MSTLKDFTSLWGEELVEEIRNRFPNPEDLPTPEECEELYELLRRRGCQLPMPTRGRPIKNLLEDLVEGQDPIYTEKKPIGPAGPIEPTEITPLSELEKLRAELELEKSKLQQAAQLEEIRKLRKEITSLRLQREKIEETSRLSDHSSVVSEPQAPAIPREPPLILGKSIKLLSTLIPPLERFAGQDDRSIVEDLLIFEGLCEANNIPKSQWGQILVYVLKGDARRFFRSQPVTLHKDYDRAKQALIDRYLSPEKMDRLKIQYNDLSLKDCGSLEKYGEELLRLFKHLPEGYATEAALIDKLILGIGQEEVTRLYRTVRPKTYAAAMELVRVWAKPPRKGPKLLYANQSFNSTSQQRRSKKQPVKGKPKKALNIPQNVVCHNCGRPGHYATRCLQPRVPRCGLCGLTGHFTRQCPTLPEDLRNKFDGLYLKNLSTAAAITSPPLPTPASTATPVAQTLQEEEASKN